MCNTKNRYIFYIENKYTKQVLNVGSDCIIDFPSLNNIDGVSINKIKNIKVRETAKISRILKFNKNFTDAQNLIKNLELEYENLPILLPYSLYIRLPEIFRNMRNLYNEYINNKIQDDAFIKFKNLLEDYFSLKQAIDEIDFEKNIITLHYRI